MQIINYDGKIAVQIDRYALQDTPVDRRRLLVAQHLPARDYDFLLGCRFEPSGSAWRAPVYTGLGRYVTLDLEQAEHLTIDTPIQKPRDGREHTWTWFGGHWVRQGFPRCLLCNRWHDPAYVHCAQCERPAPAKAKRCRNCDEPLTAPLPV